MMAKILLTDLIIVICVLIKDGTSKGIMFDVISLPSENWVVLPSSGSVEDGMLKGKATCLNACIMRGDECHGYEVHDDDTCTLGKIQPAGPSNYVPEYVMAGKRVYLKADKVKKKAVLGVMHLASINSANTYDTAFEDTRFGAVDLPTPFSKGNALITTNYKSGFLTCGGFDEDDNYLRKCRLVFNYINHDLISMLQLMPLLQTLDFQDQRMEGPSRRDDPSALPGSRSLGWWQAVCLLRHGIRVWLVPRHQRCRGVRL